jgi:hypothetical protein
MGKPVPGWYWTNDPDMWILEHPHGPYKDRDGALAAAVPRPRRPEVDEHGKLLDHGPLTWTGEIFDVRFDMKPFGTAMVEEAKEQAMAQAGDEADAWPAIGDAEVKDLGNALHKVFEMWVAKYKLAPEFVGITEVMGHGAEKGHQF